MAQADLTINPRSGFVVGQLLPLGVTDRQVLTSLYLPLIGATALALYETLLDFQTTTGELSQRYAHSELLATLSIDLPTLVKNRQRLEATGLLQTYQQTDELGMVYLYLPKAPVAPASFFADDLLSVMLLDTLGEQRYQRAVDQFKLKEFKLTHAKEVSASFLDVFHVSEQRVLQTPTAVETSRQDVPITDQHKATVTDQTTLDWQLLGQLLKNDYVDLEQLTNYRELITTESQVYGLNEVELAKLIATVTSLATGKFDPNQLKLEISRRYQRRTAQPAENNATQSTATEASQGQFTTVEKGLLAAAKYYAPYNFLDTIKAQKHSFSTDGEQRLVRDLVGRVSFSPSVVNVLIYYLLENRSTLNKNLMETVADDWQQHQITTPEAALAYIKQRQQPTTKPKGNQRGRSSGNQRAPRQEKLPEWAAKQKAGQQLTNQEQLDKEEQARLEARIAKQKQQTKHEEG